MSVAYTTAWFFKPGLAGPRVPVLVQPIGRVGPIVVNGFVIIQQPLAALAPQAKQNSLVSCCNGRRRLAPRPDGVEVVRQGVVFYDQGVTLVKNSMFYQTSGKAATGFSCLFYHAAL